MTISSVISNLVSFCVKKKKTSNGCKPIRGSARTKLLDRDLCLPLGYMLPNVQPQKKNFFNRFTSLRFGSLPFNQKKGCRNVKTTINIWYIDQSKFFESTELPNIWSIGNSDTLSILRKDDKNHPKFNFKEVYAHGSFGSPKFPCFLAYIGMSLIKPFILFVRPNMTSHIDDFFCV